MKTHDFFIIDPLGAPPDPLQWVLWDSGVHLVLQERYLNNYKLYKIKKKIISHMVRVIGISNEHSSSELRVIGTAHHQVDFFFLHLNMDTYPNSSN